MTFQPKSADDLAALLLRLAARNRAEQKKWHDIHHADPAHSCNFKKPDCPYCVKDKTA